MKIFKKNVLFSEKDTIQPNVLLVPVMKQTIYASKVKHKDNENHQSGNHL